MNKVQKMQQNKKDAEEQQQRRLPSMKIPQSIAQPQQKRPLSLKSIKHNKSQYFVLLSLLLEIIMSVVLLVLLITLNYIGFRRVNQAYQTQKILFEGENCQDIYLIEISKFVGIRIKSAFVFLCVELLVSFVNVILGVKWMIKVIKGYNHSNDVNKLHFLRKDCYIMNIFVPFCIVLGTLMFGTYLNFAVLGNRTELDDECRFRVFNKEIIWIVILLVIKLVIYLIIWMIVMCVTSQVNRSIQYLINLSRFKLPHNRKINQFNSVSAGEYNINIKPQQGNDKLLKNGNQIINEEEQFKQLKTQDFLLQLKNNSKDKQTFQNNQQVEEFQIQQQKIYPEQQDQTSNRRMMAYQPLESQKYISDNNIPLPIVPKDQVKRKQSVEQYSVNNSLEKQKDQNFQLLINSVERVNNNDRLGNLPLSSKKKPLVRESLSISNTQKLNNNLDTAKQLPSKKVSKLQQKQQQPQHKKKQWQNKEVKSIIMQLDALSEKQRKELNKYDQQN